MDKFYELYGGPLDGLVVNTGCVVGEGSELEIDAVSEEYMPEVGKVLTRPTGVVVFEMSEGRLSFVREVPNKTVNY